MAWFELIGFGPNGWGLQMLIATGMTVAVATCGAAAGLVMGTLAAWAKLSSSRVARLLADGYTTILRGVPDLLIIYFFYFGGSLVLTYMSSHVFGTSGFVSVPAFTVGALALGIANGGYQAEVLRGAYLAVAKGELEAARAVGMSQLLMFRRIIAPQVMRYAIPGLGNCWQLCLKESALVTVTGLVELLRQSNIAGRSTREPFLFFSAAAILYLLITVVSGYLFARAEKRALRGMRRA